MRFVFCCVLMFLATPLSAQGTFSGVDDGILVLPIYTNTGQADHHLNITLDPASDTSFDVNVYDKDGKLLGSIHIETGNVPVVTVPSGGSARVDDPTDANSDKPIGSYTVT